MIKTQNLDKYPEFGEAASKTAPDPPKYSSGFLPADVLPAEWLNWAWAKNSKGISDLNAGVLAMEAELNAALEAGGVAPEGINGQVLAAIKNIILQRTGTLTELRTANKSTIVAACNELLSAIRAHEGRRNNPHGVTKAQVGLGNVPNVSTNDQPPTYGMAPSLVNLSSGEKLAGAFSKIARAIADLIAHRGARNNSHGVTKAQVGLGNVDNTRDDEKSVASASVANAVKDYAGGGDIQIGYQGASLAADEINYLAAYKDGQHIKDAHKDAVKKWLGINNVDNTPDSSKSVDYAKRATNAAIANNAALLNGCAYKWQGKDGQPVWLWGGNTEKEQFVYNPKNFYVKHADTAKNAANADNCTWATRAVNANNADAVCGYKAGNGVGMLVPVVAFNAGENAGYIKLGNGFIVQWGAPF